MSSKAFKHYIRFVMSKHDIKNYTIKYKIAINYNMTNGQLRDITELGDSNGLIDKNVFYETIKNYGFLNNRRLIETKKDNITINEFQEEIYEVPGRVSKNVDIPEDITFDLDDTIQQILNIPAQIEYKYELKKINKNDTKKLINLTKFKSNMSDNDWGKYIKQTYNKSYGLMDVDFLNNKEQALQLPIYNKEECEYSTHAYKHTFGVLVYLEDDKNVCPICYSESNNPHIILDNFKIIWDNVGIITLKDNT